MCSLLQLLQRRHEAKICRQFHVLRSAFVVVGWFRTSFDDNLLTISFCHLISPWSRTLFKPNRQVPWQHQTCAYNDITASKILAHAYSKTFWIPLVTNSYKVIRNIFDVQSHSRAAVVGTVTQLIRLHVFTRFHAPALQDAVILLHHFYRANEESLSWSEHFDKGTCFRGHLLVFDKSVFWE